MAPPEKQAAAPIGKIGSGGKEYGFGSTVPAHYSSQPISATEFAVRLIGRRYRLPAPTARLVCLLAGIGGAA